MARTLILPERLARFTEGFGLANTAKGGVISITGAQQNVPSAAQYWQARLTFNARKEDDYLAVDAFLAGLDGVANNFLCGPVDWRGRPWNVNPRTRARITPAMGRRDAAINPAYATNPDTTSVLSFKLGAAALMNATSVVVQRVKGGYIKPGQYFSIGNRLHIITDLLSVDPLDSAGLPAPGSVTVSIRPWLRLDYPVNTVLEFAKPVGLMQLTKESANMLERTTSPLAELPLSIKEYF